MRTLHIIVFALLFSTGYAYGYTCADPGGGPAQLCNDDGVLLPDQDPPHVICINGTCQTETAHGTATFTVTTTATDAVTGSGTSSYLPKWGTASGTSTATTRQLSNSIIRQNASGVEISGHLDPGTDGTSEMGYNTQRWWNLHLKSKVFLYGATSGYVGIQSPSVATAYTLTLPPDDGEPGQFPQTNGSGVLSWAFATDLGTATASHVLVFPNAAHTVTSTVTITETDMAQTAAGVSKIPMAGTNSKIDTSWLPTTMPPATHTHTVSDVSGIATHTHVIGDLPTGTATNKVITGADPRMTDARNSTNYLYAGSSNVYFSIGTATATLAAVANSPSVHVSAMAANAFHITNIDSHYTTSSHSATTGNCTAITSASLTLTASAGYVYVSANASVHASPQASADSCWIKIQRSDTTVPAWAWAHGHAISGMGSVAYMSLSVSGFDSPGAGAETWTLYLCTGGSTTGCYLDATNPSSTHESGSITAMQAGY